METQTPPVPQAFRMLAIFLPLLCFQHMRFDLCWHGLLCPVGVVKLGIYTRADCLLRSSSCSGRVQRVNVHDGFRHDFVHVTHAHWHATDRLCSIPPREARDCKAHSDRHGRRCAGKTMANTCTSSSMLLDRQAVVCVWLRARSNYRGVPKFWIH
jgi:hypothetical protein